MTKEFEIEVLDLAQGSPEWLAHRIEHFNASEAPFLMGKSNKQSRQELLHLKATKSEKEFSDWVVEHIFQSGHDAEAAARPIIEEQYDIELSPITAKRGRYSMSSDGINFGFTKGWEHKVYNKELFELVSDGKWPDDHIWQMEHFFLVIPTLKEVIFTVSDGTEENMVSMIYKSKPARRKKLIAAWELFEKDLEKYEPPKAVEKVHAEEVKQLPALNYEVKGTLVSTNLDAYSAQADELIQKALKPMENDQDFVNAIELVKTFESAEKKINLIKEEIIAKFSSLNETIERLDDIHSKIRGARLQTNPKIEAEKSKRKTKLVSDGEKEILEYFDAANTIEGVSLAKPIVNPMSAIKGLKNPEKMKEAIAQYVADMKLAIDEQAELVGKNMELFAKVAGGNKSLFPDLSEMAHKEADDFEAAVSLRLMKHKQEQDEKARKEAEKKQQEEEQAQESQEVIQEEALVNTFSDDIAPEQTSLVEESNQGDVFSNENHDIHAIEHAADFLEELVFPEMKTARGQEIMVKVRNSIKNISDKARTAAKTI